MLNALATKTLKTKAYSLGRTARLNETATAPCQCPEMMAVVKELGVASGSRMGVSLPFLKAWCKGFHSV